MRLQRLPIGMLLCGTSNYSSNSNSNMLNLRRARKVGRAYLGGPIEISRRRKTEKGRI